MKEPRLIGLFGQISLAVPCAFAAHQVALAEAGRGPSPSLRSSWPCALRPLPI